MNLGIGDQEKQGDELLVLVGRGVFNQLANRVRFRTFRSKYGCSQLLVRMCSRLALSGEHDMAASVTIGSKNVISG